MVVIQSRKRARVNSYWRFRILEAVVLMALVGFLRVRNEFLTEKSKDGKWKVPTEDSEALIGEPQNKSQATPRVAFVTFVHLKDYSRFEKYIFPALETFLVNEIYHVVLQEVWKEKYHSDLCRHNETYAGYCNRVNPIFVDCPEGKFGESPCCKQEKGLLHLLETAGDRYDWFCFQDDDVYLRISQLRSFLNNFPPDSVMTIVPQLAKQDSIRALGHVGYLGRPNYTCAIDDANFTYLWGQPVFYTRAALQHVSNGFRAGGLVKQCIEYQVTHDAGNAIFHWMYSIASVKIRISSFPTRNDPSLLGSHGVEHAIKETLDRRARKESHLRKRISQITPGMREVHDKFLKMEYVEPPILWHNVSGFRQTATFRTHGDPSSWGTEWHTMPIDDCQGPHV